MRRAVRAPIACVALLAAAASAACTPPRTTLAPAASARIEIDSIDARTLGRRVRYHVALPSGYDAADRTRRYPVLWLLHGLDGNDANWSERTALARDLAPYAMIVVMPDAANSWYTNAPGDTTARYDDFVTRELPAAMARRYAIDTLRQGIAGLSMGGYGAIVLALRHPGQYRFAGGLSAALSVPATRDSVLERVGGASLAHAFGPAGGAARAAYDPFRIFRNTPPGALPYVFLAIGNHDGFRTFLPANRALTDSLRAYGGRYEYHELPGTHSWRFWDAELGPMLARAWDEMTASRASTK